MFQNGTDASGQIERQCVGIWIPGNTSVFRSQITTSKKTWGAPKEENTTHNVNKGQHLLITSYMIIGMLILFNSEKNLLSLLRFPFAEEETEL